MDGLKLYKNDIKKQVFNIQFKQVRLTHFSWGGMNDQRKINNAKQ